MISMVWPDMVLRISPGRYELPSGMFSTRPIAPMALTFALRAASACMSPTTQAAPAMSPFMSSMPAACLIEMPPVSKQTPLPMNATGGAPRELFRIQHIGGLVDKIARQRYAVGNALPGAPRTRDSRRTGDRDREVD